MLRHLAFVQLPEQATQAAAVVIHLTLAGCRGGSGSRGGVVGQQAGRGPAGSHSGAGKQHKN
jgi:hypothetical protein